MAKSTKAPQRVTIERMSLSLERTLRSELRSEKTIYSYLLSVRLLSEFLSARGHDLTVDVSTDDLRDFITEQSTRRKLVSGKYGGSPATALVRYKSLKQFFRHCVLEDELDVSPMDRMTAPPVKDSLVPVVSDDVLARLLKMRSGKTFVDRRDTAILRVFLDTGCRKAEVTNLRIGDLDEKNQTITVLGKGDKPRLVPYGAKTGTAIDRYLRVLEREQTDRVTPEGKLWVGRQGPLSTSGIDDVLHRMCDDAGVPRLHWHQLRHTFAHTWLANGGNEGDLMSNAGWSSRSMLDRYAKSAQVERAHAAAKRMSLGDRV